MKSNDLYKVEKVLIPFLEIRGVRADKKDSKKKYKSFNYIVMGNSLDALYLNNIDNKILEDTLLKSATESFTPEDLIGKNLVLPVSIDYSKEKCLMK